MLPGNGLGDADKTCYPGSPEQKFKYGSEGLNTTDIQEYIRNPHKFNTNGKMDGQYYNLWSTDNDKTDGNDDVVIKSVYDPSPVGYSLPASNAFTGFTTTGQNTGNPGNPAIFNVKGSYDKGWYFYNKPNKQGGNIFFPASGIRTFNIGSMTYTLSAGLSWTTGVENGERAIDFTFDINFISPLDTDPKTDACPVRSAEEK